ncbi:DsbA family oxidoreductase [Scleromatobacter humisilvae]|uniref:DsbA family oxidoreductase n=1 Tax=Scleromatobacter humisilvae TaxID=2897159 RepID=A0A9X1YMP9_9BURK|nr:DsbA family oxidoreductase [Scleromatobacter humisilvae]MCK9689409.1 DsbA family oxidoreductase [Scleromatobacter humisilvae]
MSAQIKSEVRLQIASDVVCPWCFIGKRAIDQALPILKDRGVDVTIEWLPFQLNPTLPAEGMDRKKFRTARFGSWEAALAMDDRAIKAGAGVGAQFRYDRQKKTSNTLAGHALVRLAGVEGGASLQERVVEALFVAYFTDGKDVGDEAILEQIATSSGMEPGAVLRSRATRKDVAATEAAIRSAGLEGVPSYIVDGRLLSSGAQDVAGYVRMLTAVARPI